MSARPVRHGTVTGYFTDGCREECCRAASREYARQRAAKKRGPNGGRNVGPAPTIPCDACAAPIVGHPDGWAHVAAGRTVGVLHAHQARPRTIA